MVPKGWSVKPIGSVVKRVSVSVTPEPDVLYRQIGIRSHGKGIFHKEAVLGKSLGEKRVYKVLSDCFVVNIVFAWEQAVARTTNNEDGMIASHRFPMYRPKDDLSDVDFLTYYFKSKKGKYLLMLASPGGAGRNKTLGQKEFEKLAFPMPSRKEQTRIAQILSTWDRAIEITEALIANAQAQKKALMQQLLTGEKRIPGYQKAWKEVQLEDVSSPQQWTTISTSDLLPEGYPVYGANGFIGYFSEFNHEFDTVTVTCRGSTCGEVSLIHGKSYITGNSMALDEVKSNICDYRYLYYALKYRGFRDVISGSAQPQIVGSAIRKVRFKLPELGEQSKIAGILASVDAELQCLNSQRILLKMERDSLMQQLLTGKRRVKLDSVA